MPTFGDWFTGIYASDDNPTKHGMYVRTIRRTGRMNNGTFYELTDGKGEFWQSSVENCEPRTDPAAPVIPVGSEARAVKDMNAGVESRPVGSEAATANDKISSEAKGATRGPVGGALARGHRPPQPLCPRCNGEGRIDAEARWVSTDIDCPDCQGTGTRPVERGFVKDCQACEGKGYKLCDDAECHPGCRDAKCKACQGTGHERVIPDPPPGTFIGGAAHIVPPPERVIPATDLRAHIERLARFEYDWAVGVNGQWREGYVAALKDLAILARLDEQTGEGKP